MYPIVHQVVVWDTNSSQKKTTVIQKNKNSSVSSATSKEEEDSKRVVTLIPYYVSSCIEQSHRKPVTDLVWLQAKVSEMSNWGADWFTCFRCLLMEQLDLGHKSTHSL
jgi:hypothetical protein